MKIIHIAIATNDIDKTVKDYSFRLGFEPSLVIPDEYALWRNETINLSIRKDSECAPGKLRHLGWEDPDASGFTAAKDTNGILWENFSAQHQAEEIEAAWPGTSYVPGNAY